MKLELLKTRPHPPCRHCANCCTETTVPLTDADVRRIMKYTGMHAGDIVRMYDSTETDYETERPGWIKLSYGKRLMALRRKNHRCLFLSRENFCTIYPARPITCRTFPYMIYRPQAPSPEVRINTAIRCKCKYGPETDFDELVAAALREEEEDAAYHEKVERWNRRGYHGDKASFLEWLLRGTG